MDIISLLTGGQPVAYAMVVLSLVAATGLALGSLSVGNMRLGIGGALFTGIAFAHFGVTVDPVILGFIRDFGLILFVYAIGLQVGPGFFNALKKEGLALNLLGLAIVALGIAITVGLVSLAGLPMAAGLGIFAGATTNMPSLAAAQQMLKSVGAPPADVVAAGLALAVTYPFGIIGNMMAMLAVRHLLGISPTDEAKRFNDARMEGHHGVETMNIEVRNPALEGLTVRQIPGITHLGVVLSQVLHDGSQAPVGPDQKLAVGDVVLAVGPRHKLHDLRVIFGGVEAPVNLEELPTDLRWERLVVTSNKVLGHTIGQLDLAAAYGTVVSRCNRAGLELTPNAQLALQFGDILTVIGEPEDIKRVAVLVGNTPAALNHAHVVPIFIGIALGAILGSLPVHIPGLPAPLKLGLAGGPLIAAIVLARIGHLGPLVWFLPPSANQVLRELGIVLFLGAVGVQSGSHFVDTLVNGDGLLWMGYGVLVTALPLAVVGLLARLWLKLNFLTLMGVMSGAMTNPPALQYSNTMQHSEAQALAYATVYPLAMFLRVLSPQIMVLLLG
ncbi:MAG: putative transporter [Rhodospirillaceae bacterium]|nr:putative transporter [Rhodospirillales bacterium]